MACGRLPLWFRSDNVGAVDGDASTLENTRDPLALFEEWFADARQHATGRHPAAVCVSTVDADGVPAGRFVDLKAVVDAGFIFCTQLDSDKGRAIEVNARVALTFWWDHVGRQVRVTGTAERVDDAEADAFFRQRSRDAQLASAVSQQSAPLGDLPGLEHRRAVLARRYAGVEIPRPANWGAYLVKPSRIEFLTFMENRMHLRRLFQRAGSTWTSSWLQP